LQLSKQFKITFLSTRKL